MWKLTLNMAGIKKTNFENEQSYLQKQNSWALFIGIFMLEVVVGYYLCHIKGFFSSDALSRVANAFFVLYIKPPHLAAIGSVWNPLPSLLELLLMPLWHIYKPIVSSGLAGTMITAACTAGTAILLLHNCRCFGWKLWKADLLVLAYVFNPFVFIYGLNGMSEAVFFFCIVWAVTKFTQWLDNKLAVNLVNIAMAFAFGFLTRYEAVPFAMALSLGIALICYWVYPKEVGLDYSRKDKIALVEGTFVLALTPFFYTILGWIFYNWIIQGDPLYFLHSTYSNSAQSVNIVYMKELTSIKGSTIGILLYILNKSYAFLPLFAVVLLLRILSKRIFKIDFIIVCGIILSLELLQFVLLYKQESFGWFRFFAYPLPIMVAWLPYELKQLNNYGSLLKRFAFLFSFLALIVSMVLVIKPLFGAECQKEYDNFFNLQQKKNIQEQRAIAAYINKNLGNSKILMDSFLTSCLIINLDHPGKLTTTCSYNFKKAVKNPVKQGIQYILLPNPDVVNINRLDAINIQYPNLYKNGAEWCTEYKEFIKSYKLFRVHNPSKRLRKSRKDD